MSEEQKRVIKKLTESLPEMTEREIGYLEGTIATAAAMSRKGQPEQIQRKEETKEEAKA